MGTIIGQKRFLAWLHAQRCRMLAPAGKSSPDFHGASSEEEGPKGKRIWLSDDDLTASTAFFAFGGDLPSAFPKRKNHVFPSGQGIASGSCIILHVGYEEQVRGALGRMVVLQLHLLSDVKVSVSASHRKATSLTLCSGVTPPVPTARLSRWGYGFTPSSLPPYTGSDCPRRASVPPSTTDPLHGVPFLQFY